MKIFWSQRTHWKGRDHGLIDKYCPGIYNLPWKTTTTQWFLLSCRKGIYRKEEATNIIHFPNSQKGWNSIGQINSGQGLDHFLIDTASKHNKFQIYCNGWAHVPPIFITSAGDFSNFFSESTMLAKDGRSLGSLCIRKKKQIIGSKELKMLLILIGCIENSNMKMQHYVYNRSIIKLYMDRSPFNQIDNYRKYA